MNVTGIGTVTSLNVTDASIGTGTSINSPAANTLSLGTNNTERLRITSAGKIGFNAANPPRDYCFHSGQADTNIQIQYNNTTGIDDSAGSLIQQDGNDLYIWNKENLFPCHLAPMPQKNFV